MPIVPVVDRGRAPWRGLGNLVPLAYP
jgi:hypothetical protein